MPFLVQLSHFLWAWDLLGLGVYWLGFGHWNPDLPHGRGENNKRNNKRLFKCTRKEVIQKAIVQEYLNKCQEVASSVKFVMQRHAIFPQMLQISVA